MLKEKPFPKRIDITPQKMEELLKRVEERKPEEGDWDIIKGMAQTITFMGQVLPAWPADRDEKSMSIARLLKMVFGVSTESKKNVLGKSDKEEQRDHPPEDPDGKDPGDPAKDAPDGGKW